MPLDLLADKENTLIGIAADANSTEVVAVDNLIRWSHNALELTREHRYSVVEYMASGDGAFTLPEKEISHDGWSCFLFNNSAGTLTIEPASGDTIRNKSNNTIQLQPQSWVKVVSDGRRVAGDGYWLAIEGATPPSTTTPPSDAHSHSDLTAKDNEQDQSLKELKEQLDSLTPGSGPHDHAGQYAPADHTHDGGTPGDHNHDADYAPSDHDHASQFAPTEHKHDDLAILRAELDALKGLVDQFKAEYDAHGPHGDSTEPHPDPSKLNELEQKINDLEAKLDDYQLKAEKSQLNGYASLGPDAKVPKVELPIALSQSDYGTTDDEAEAFRLVDLNVLDRYAAPRDEINFRTFDNPNDWRNVTMGVTTNVTLNRSEAGPNGLLAVWDVKATGGTLELIREFSAASLEEDKAYDFEIYARVVSDSSNIFLFGIGVGGAGEPVTAQTTEPSAQWIKLTAALIFSVPFTQGIIALQCFSTEGSDEIHLQIAGCHVVDESASGGERILEDEKRMTRYEPQIERSFFNVDVLDMAFLAAERVAGRRDAINMSVFPDPHLWAEWALTATRVVRLNPSILGPGNATWTQYALQGTETLLAPATLTRTLTAEQVPAGQYEVSLYVGIQQAGTAPRAINIELNPNDGTTPQRTEVDLPNLATDSWRLVTLTVAVTNGGLIIEMEWIARSDERLILLWPNIQQFTPKVSESEKQITSGVAGSFVRTFSPADVQEIASIVAESLAAKRSSLNLAAFEDPVTFSDFTASAGLSTEYTPSAVGGPFANAYTKVLFRAPAGGDHSLAKTLTLNVAVDGTYSIGLWVFGEFERRSETNLEIVLRNAGGTPASPARINRSRLSEWQILTLTSTIAAGSSPVLAVVVSSLQPNEGFRIYGPEIEKL